MLLREESHPDKLDEKILVATRDVMTWRYQVRMHHATGDYWVVYLTTPHNPTLLNDFQSGGFRRGADGKVSELEITWASRMSDQGEGTTVFKRIRSEYQL